MSFLLLYVAEDHEFERHLVTESLQHLPGTTLSGNPGAMMYRYKLSNDDTTIRLDEDRRFIVIDGSGPASLAAALHIQSHYLEDIHLADEAYSFDIILRGLASPHELQRRIEDAGG